MSGGFFSALEQGERELPLPFKLEIDGDQLLCQESLRVLPGKRVTIAGMWRDEPVVAKFFLPGAARELAAEQSGYRALKEACIDTPEMLWSGKLADDSGVVVYRYLVGAVSMADLLQSAQRSSAIRDCFVLLSCMHRKGVWQGDIHFDNFLYVSGRLYVIDNGSVKNVDSRLKIDARIENLGQLIAQFSWAERDELFGYLSSYELDIDVEKLRKASARFWWKRVNKYLKKIFRDCTEVAVRRDKRVFLAYKRRLNEEWIDQFVNDPDRLMEKAELIKSGNSATVVRSDINGRAVVIKRYNIKNFSHALRRLMRKTRAWNVWRAGHLLKNAGLKTPEPLVLLEKRWGPFRGVSYLISDYVPGEEMLDAYGRREPLHRELEKIFSIFKVMHQLRLCHGDFKAKNFLVTDNDIQLLDLDVMRERRCYLCFRYCEKKDRLRFLRNWSKQPELNGVFEGLINKAVT